MFRTYDNAQDNVANIERMKYIYNMRQFRDASLTSLAFSIITMEIGADEDFVPSPIPFDFDEAVMHNPLIHYLVETILQTQKENRNIIRLFNDQLMEMMESIGMRTESILELQRQIESEFRPSKKHPGKYVYEGKMINQAQFEQMIEYAVKLHVANSRTIAGNGLPKNRIKKGEPFLKTQDSDWVQMRPLAHGN
jgi:hypothetical protein